MQADNVQALIAIAVFVSTIALIMLEQLHISIIALLGVLVLVFTRVMTLNDAVAYISRGHETLALFFGIMVLIRAFKPTNVFTYLASQILIIAKGQGKRLLLGIVVIVTTLCTVLPNATVVLLLAPLIPPIAQEIGIDFVPILILIVFIANSSGLLTLIGDPATFIVGRSINMSFLEYLRTLSLGGVFLILTVTFMIPWLFPRIWRLKFEHLKEPPQPEIKYPKVLALGCVLVAFVLIFFIIGELFPVPISPDAVALLGATFALLLAHQSRMDTAPNILKDVDWSTLIFFMCIFVLVGGLEKTGVIEGLSGVLAALLGSNIGLGPLLLIWFVGILSGIIPNIPMVVAMVPLLKKFLINIGLVGQEVLDPNFTGQLPPEVLPLFFAMMYGATLGGNGTLVGASANIVAAGIAEQYGSKMTFRTFLKYSIPILIMQLIVASVYFIIFIL